MLTFENAYILRGKQKLLNGFESGIFSIKKQTQGKENLLDLARAAHIAPVAKVSDRKQLKILTPKQMFQRLSIALAEVKVGNTSGNILNDIRQIIYSLYQTKEFTKKVYNNIMNSTNL